MKTLKYILIFIIGLGAFNSCIVDDETNYDLNDKGVNLAGFELTSTTVSGIADGTEYTFDMRVKVKGPTVLGLTNDITLTVGVDPNSTAIEGTHFSIVNPTITLTASDNYLGLIHVKMLTQGIVTPLAKSPVLILTAASATGDPNVVNTGKTLTITMNFACFSEFQGDYNVTITSSTGAVVSRVETIDKIGVEQYLTHSVGTWNPPLSDYGVIFENSCNILTVPFMDLLANTYSNDVWGHKLGSRDPATGVITLYYTIAFAAGNREYTAVYTPVGK
jgi:hypothetical protein